MSTSSVASELDQGFPRLRWARRRWLALLVAVSAVPVLAAGLASSLYWPDRLFPGFFLLADDLVPTVGLYSWTGLAGGVPFHARVISANGRPIHEPTELYDLAEAVPEGTSIRYVLEKGGARFVRD